MTIYRQNIVTKFCSLWSFISLTGYCTISRETLPQADKLIQNGIDSIDDYRFKSKWKSNDPIKSEEDLYKEIVIDVRKIMQQVKLFLESQVNGSNRLLLTSFSDENICQNQTLFVIKEYYYNGDCLVLVMPDCLSQAGPLEIALEFNISVHIFLHHKGLKYLGIHFNIKF